MDTSSENRSKNISKTDDKEKPDTGMFTGNETEKTVSETSSNNTAEANDSGNNLDSMLQMIHMINMLKGTQNSINTPAEINTNSVSKDDADIQNFQAVQAVAATSTPFDEMLQTPAIKALKAAIPYLEPQQQKNIGLFVKLFEVQQLMNIYNKEGSYAIQTQNSYPNNRTAVLNAMRAYVPKEKQPMIDILIKIIDIKEIYEKIK